MNTWARNFISAMPLIAIMLGLSACDPNRMPKSEKSIVTPKDARKACIFVAGGSYGKSGLRARQYVGKGPKMRAVQWKTADYLDEFQDLPNSAVAAKKPAVAIQLTWRISTIKDIHESSFHSLEARAVNAVPLELARAAFWRVGILDNESVDIPVSRVEGGEIYDLFSSEDRGKQIPAHIGEALGGVNGGGFYIALIASDGTEILANSVKPIRGYEFKDKVKLAFEGLDEQLKDEKNCVRKSTHLRLEKSGD